ncbi:amidohydrolase family protein [Haliea sp. AH-315-K21]|nr:amidohydrolase family protein [Haliea sp. AH-315-K21]
MKTFCLLVIGLFSTTCVYSQAPIIDMHLHAFSADFSGPIRTGHCVSPDSMMAWDQRENFAEAWSRLLTDLSCTDPVWAPETDAEIMSDTIAVLNKLNIFGVASGTPELVQNYVESSSGRLLYGLNFGLGVEGADFSPAEVMQLHEQGRLDVLGEITNQYVGIEPSDERMDEYWSLAEELNIPVAIHIGPSPPGSPYIGYPNYRARLHSPLTLEEVLVEHPTLRVQVMHAGYPMLDDMLAMLYAHPQIYVDLGLIDWLLTQAEFYRHLKSIVDAGYSNRIMYGSDQMIWPGVIELSINSIMDAPFLSAQQKRDILYNNAARFLRLSNEEIQRHHAVQ